ncbi:MAG: hypothetical protein FWG63_00030 [Defluviitaleaceae bacterium]|nr:hypothetical protein [Defluviitaleaceae bacterium]
MTKYEQLEKKTESLGICIHNFKFSDTKKAAYREIGGYKAVILDESAIETTCEKTVLLSHELAHYETGTVHSLGDIVNSPLVKMNRRKDEAKANRHSIQVLLPFEELQKSISRCCDMFEVAEMSGVTVDFLFEAIDFYKTQNKNLKFPDNTP